MSQLSPQTQKLIQKYKEWYDSLIPKEGVSTIHVDEIASKVAAFYEKIRMIVDWKEEHLIRRVAIIRKLKRRFLNWDLDKFSSKEDFAEPLVLELIRGGHFQNDKIEESKLADVQMVINKYIFILKNCPEARNPREKFQFLNWLFEIAACEIEETIAPFIKEIALIDYMFELMKERIRLSEGVFSIGGLKIKEEEKDIQIYIAIQQALFKLDHPIISYNLLKYRFPQWKKATLEQLKEMAKNIYGIWQKIEEDLSHPLGKKFYTICEKYDTPYLLLGDILSGENSEEVLNKILNPEALEGLIRNAYNKRFFTLRRRLFRAAFYTTLSVLLGNGLSLFLLEMPLARIIHGRFTPLSIVVDIFESTLLMFLFLVTIKLPLESNLNLVVVETMKIVYKTEKRDIYEIKIPRKRGLIMQFIVGLTYLFGASVSLTILIWIFQLAKFPATSVVINIIFIPITVFAGLTIRKKSEELTVEEKKAGFFGFLFDIFSLPVAGLGRWLSNKWKRYNAIAAFFNALIDMPFTLFVEFLEQWRFFLKEKKEEIH